MCHPSRPATRLTSSGSSDLLFYVSSDLKWSSKATTSRWAISHAEARQHRDRPDPSARLVRRQWHVPVVARLSGVLAPPTSSLGELARKLSGCKTSNEANRDVKTVLRLGSGEFNLTRRNAPGVLREGLITMLTRRRLAYVTLLLTLAGACGLLALSRIEVYSEPSPPPRLFSNAPIIVEAVDGRAIQDSYVSVDDGIERVLASTEYVSRDYYDIEATLSSAVTSHRFFVQGPAGMHVDIHMNGPPLPGRTQRKFSQCDVGRTTCRIEATEIDRRAGPFGPDRYTGLDEITGDIQAFIIEVNTTWPMDVLDLAIDNLPVSMYRTGDSLALRPTSVVMLNRQSPVLPNLPDIDMNKRVPLSVLEGWEMPPATLKGELGTQTIDGGPDEPVFVRGGYVQYTDQGGSEGSGTESYAIASLPSINVRLLARANEGEINLLIAGGLLGVAGGFLVEGLGALILVPRRLRRGLTTRNLDSHGAQQDLPEKQVRSRQSEQSLLDASLQNTRAVDSSSPAYRPEAGRAKQLCSRKGRLICAVVLFAVGGLVRRMRTMRRSAK